MTGALWDGPEPIQVTVAKSALCEVGLQHVAATVFPNRIGSPSSKFVRDHDPGLQKTVAKAFFLGHQAARHDCAFVFDDDGWGIRCHTCNAATEARLAAS